MKIYLLQVVIMDSGIGVTWLPPQPLLNLVNKLLLKQVMKIQKKLKLLKQEEFKPTWLPPHPIFRFRCKKSQTYV